MRLFIAGASGRTGRLLTLLALDRGHSVTALVRDPAGLGTADERLGVVTGDVLEPQGWSDAVAGHDAVVTLLAPRPRRDGRVYIDGTRNLADAAADAGVRRFVAVSAEGAGVAARKLPLGYRLVRRIPVVARLYPDIAEMEHVLMARDDLDWTVVRAAILTNGPASGAYRVTPGDVVAHGLRVSRADLAAFLLVLLETGAHVRERVALAD